MDELDKTIIKIVNKKINTPSQYHNAIQNAFNSKENKFKYSFFKTAVTTCIGLILSTGIVIAGYTAYEKIWKEPRKYNELEEKLAIISEQDKQNAVSEEKVKQDAKEILDKVGYSDEEINKVELFRSYADGENTYYCASTEEEYSDEHKDIGIYTMFNGETGEFYYLLNNDFDDIRNKLEKIDKEKAIDVSKEILKSVGLNINSHEVSYCDETDKNEWNIKFSKSYNGIYNRFEGVQIAFGIIKGKVVVELINGSINNNFDNNEFILTEDEAINIAKNKELEFTNEEIIGITAKKSIEKMNSYIYCFENNIEDQFSVKTDNKIRNVWVVKIEHKKEPDNEDETLSDFEKQKRYISKKYYIDATTGEIIGGEQGKFTFGIE